MFAEKVCKQVVGFSTMAEDEMFEVNGGTAWYIDAITGVAQAVAGSGSNGSTGSGNKVEVNVEVQNTSGQNSPNIKTGDGSTINIIYKCDCKK